MKLGVWIGVLVWLVVWIVCFMAKRAQGNVVLMANNATMSFDDTEAQFAPVIRGSGISGRIHLAEPLNGCSELRSKAVKGPGLPFALLIRGGCSFDTKVRNAQNAGYKAAIVYDYEENDSLISMGGSPIGIEINAVFISKASGETLSEYAGREDAEVWIIPALENSTWSIISLSFITLLAVSAVFATCLFVRTHRIRYQYPRSSMREFHGMSSQLVKAMPSLIFNNVQGDYGTSSRCAICLEDYVFGDRLRLLPCCHRFHASCVDMWLSEWRTFCPVCKRDARAALVDPPASESTPLLSSSMLTASASSVLSSFPGQTGASPRREIGRPPLMPSTSRTFPGVGTPHSPSTSRLRSPAISITSRSPGQLSHSFSPGSASSHLASAHSLVSSSGNLRNGNLYMSHPGLGSPGQHFGSSGQQTYLRHGSLHPAVASPGYYYSFHGGSSGQQSYLRRNESGTSLSGIAAGQSPMQSHTLAAAASWQSLHRMYIQHCGESEPNLSAVSAMSSAQSLPGC